MRYPYVVLILTAATALCQSPIASQTLPKVRSTESVKFADEYCVTPGKLDQACIQNALKASKGGSVMIPAGAYPVSQTIDVTTNGVCIEGYGSGAEGDRGAAFGGVTYLRWAGPPGGVVFDYSAIKGSTSGRLTRACLKNLYVDCAGQASIGLAINSVAFSVFDSLTFINCTEAGIKFGLVSPLGSEADDQYNQLSNLDIRELETDGDAISLNGDTISNTSENLFLNLRLKHRNGNGLACNNDDNNVYVKVTCSRAASGNGSCVHFTTQPGTSGTSGDKAATSAREENIFGIDEGAGGILQDRLADQNAIYGLTIGNSMGTGAPRNVSSGRLSWTTNYFGFGGFNVAELTLGGITFAQLPNERNGAMFYCSDCTVTNAPSCVNVTTTAACSCTGHGTGAIAKRINGAWLCQ